MCHRYSDAAHVQFTELSFIAQMTTHSPARSWPSSSSRSQPSHWASRDAKRPSMQMDKHIGFACLWISYTLSPMFPSLVSRIVTLTIPRDILMHLMSRVSLESWERVCWNMIRSTRAPYCLSEIHFSFLHSTADTIATMIAYISFP